MADHPAGKRPTSTPYEVLRSGILRSEFAPGTAVREHALAADLGVSRTPIREALLRLEQEGLLERTSRGMRVKRRTLEELDEVYEAILVIEPAITGLAALRARPQGILHLESLIAETEAAIEQGEDPRPLMDEWHFVVWELAGNATLEDLLKRLSAQLYEIPTPAVGLTDWSASLEHHREILDAISRHDAEAAAAVMRAHMEKGRDAALRALTAEQREAGRTHRSEPTDGTAARIKATGEEG